MYPYHKELEQPNQFYTYFEKDDFRDVEIVGKVVLSDDDLKKCKKVFRRLDILDTIIESTHGELFSSQEPYEITEAIGELFSQKEYYYETARTLRKQFNFGYYDYLEVLGTYKKLCASLIVIYPNWKDFLLETLRLLTEFSKCIKANTFCVKQENNIEYAWPNAWFITPNGYLYNTGGENGHKEGNLIYPLFHDILPTLRNNRTISYEDDHKQIREILARGCVTEDEFRNYSNFNLSFPEVWTEEQERKREEFENMLRNNHYIKPPQKRSYQKNMITLVTGYLSAKTALYQSFARLNSSKKKQEIIKTLLELTNGDIRDILVCFSSFHKIETVVEHTITTSSITAIEQLKPYLDAGFDLHIIPKIVYDEPTDRLTQMDFHSYYVDKYIDEALSKYHGKGKIKIYQK